MVENEIHYLSFQEFRQMAPAILDLEVKRLAGLIDDAHDAERNDLVWARHNVMESVAAIERRHRDRLASDCAPLLEAAMITIGLLTDRVDRATLQYVLDRLAYVRDRIPYVV